jgi:hypothetical protein
LTKAIEINFPVEENMLSKRTVTVIQGIARVRYELGLMRPGEGMGFFEAFRVSMPALKHRTSGIAGKAYDLIAQDIRQIPGVLDHCVVTYSVFAENYSSQPQRIAVNVLQCHNDDDDELEKFGNAYASAHWFNQPPASGRYYIPRFPHNLLFGKQKKNILEMAEFAYLSEETFFGKARGPKGKKSIVVAKHINPLSSTLRYVGVTMPMYDCYTLPDSVQSAEQALAYIGAAHVSNSLMDLLLVAAQTKNQATAKIWNLLAVGTSNLRAAAAAVRKAIPKRGRLDGGG